MRFSRVFGGVLVEKKTADEIILNEFDCYYQADEMPSWGAEFPAYLADRAVDSAQRVIWDAGREGALGVAELLRFLAHDRDHPVLEQIVSETLIGWNDPDEWPVFQELAKRIAREIDAKLASSKG